MCMNCARAAPSPCAMWRGVCERLYRIMCAAVGGGAMRVVCSTALLVRSSMDMAVRVGVYTTLRFKRNAPRSPTARDPACRPDRFHPTARHCTPQGARVCGLGVRWAVAAGTPSIHATKLSQMATALTKKTFKFKWPFQQIFPCSSFSRDLHAKDHAVFEVLSEKPAAKCNASTGHRERCVPRACSRPQIR